MVDIIKEVKDKAKVIEDLRLEKSKQDGQKIELLKQLKDVSGTTSIATAEKKSEELSLELIGHEETLKTLAAEMDKIIAGATPLQKVLL
jgi:hypothetical protein